MEKERQYQIMEENLFQKEIQDRINKIKIQKEEKLCYSIPITFWDRKEHKVSLLNIERFNANQIPIKVRPIQMN